MSGDFRIPDNTEALLHSNHRRSLAPVSPWAMPHHLRLFLGFSPQRDPKIVG